MALIYIVEEDEIFREIEEYALSKEGFDVKSFMDAKSFYKELENRIPNLCLLDMVLPDESGNEILKKLRRRMDTRKVPVILVSSATDEYDVVKGLDEGADDFIRKPFSIMELVSRVNARLRRSEEAEDKLIGLGNIVIDSEKRKVFVDEDCVHLTYKEFELLKYLMQNVGIVLERDRIMDRIWGYDFEGHSRTLDMHIKTLRQKLGEENGKRIRTVRHVGYVMD